MNTASAPRAPVRSRTTSIEEESERNGAWAADATCATAPAESGRAVFAGREIHRPDIVPRWASLSIYRAHVRRSESRLAAERQACQRALAERKTALLEAQRRCRLLERLKERRHAEWREGVDRELQELASESFLARWNRER